MEVHFTVEAIEAGRVVGSPKVIQMLEESLVTVLGLRSCESSVLKATSEITDRQVLSF